MVNCSIRKCKNRSVTGCQVRFFSFPKDKTIANLWLQCCRPKTNSRSGIVCSVHFLPTDYQKSSSRILMNESLERCRILKPDAVPSLHLDDIVSTAPFRSVHVVNKSLESAVEYVLPDVLGINNFGIPHALKPNKIETRSVETQTIEERMCRHTETIPVSEYEELMRMKDNFEVLNKNLQKIFTPGQITCLLRPDEARVHWTEEDISAAVTLRNISQQAYDYLRTTLHVPFPSQSTISKWIKTNRNDARVRENVQREINEI